MDLTAEEVDTIAETRDLVDDLIEIADDEEAFNKANLVLLHEQLDALHQGLSLVVAQKEGLEEQSDK